MAIIVDFCVPSKFKKSPYGTILKIPRDKPITQKNEPGSPQDDEKFDQYIQVSPDEENPSWMNLGVFLEEALDKPLNDESYVSSLLELYRSQKEEM